MSIEGIVSLSLSISSYFPTEKKCRSKIKKGKGAKIKRKKKITGFQNVKKHR